MPHAEQPDTGRFVVHPTISDHLSWIRTRLSAERTMMSWARTSIALIGFGFTIVKFFEALRSMEGYEAGRFINAPRYLGLLLIACGTAALVVAIWEYRRVVQYLWSADFRVIAGMQNIPHTPVLAAAVVLVLIGVFTFTALAFQLA